MRSNDPGARAAVSGRRHLRRFGPTGVGLVVVFVSFVFVLPRIADYGEVWEQMRTLSWQWVVVLAGAVVLNISTFAPPWMVALPGLRYRQALVMTQASTALSIVLPAGAAVGMAGSYAMLRSWAFGPAQVALAVTLAGLWNQLATLAFPVVGLFAVNVSGGGGQPLLSTVAFVGAAVFGVVVAALVLVLATDTLAREIGAISARVATVVRRWLRRGPITWGAERFVRFRRESIGLLRRRWWALTLATLAGNFTVFLLLLCTLRAFGVTADDVSFAEAFAAWGLVRVLGLLPITPGGLGVVEVGLTGALVGFGGANAAVVAAVLVYRFLQMVPTLVLGGLAGLTWKRHHPLYGQLDR